MATQFLDTTADHNWSTAGNWSDGVPDAADAVTIGPLVTSLIVDAAGTCLSLNTTGAASGFVLSGSAGLTVAGNITLKGTTTQTYSGTFSITADCTFTSNGSSFTDLNILMTGGKVLTLSGATAAPTFFLSWSSESDVSALVLGANLTCSTLFHVHGSATGNYPEIRSSVLGTARTITAATTDITGRIGFMDIIGAGAGSWGLSAIESGNCGGNSGITFATATPQYWHVDAGSWSNAAKWFTATNGGGSAGRVPLPQDNVIFDASSIDSASQTITCDCLRMGASIDFEAIDVATTVIAFGTGADKYVYGSFAMCANCSWTGSIVKAIYLYGRGTTYTIKTNAKEVPDIVYIYCPTGTYQLLDSLSMQALTLLSVNYGTFDANDMNVTFGYFSLGNSNGYVLMGNSNTWTATRGSTTPWNVSSPANLTCETATIKLTGTLTAARDFAGGGATYYNFWNATTGAFAVNITGSNTFADFKIDAGRAQTFTKDTTQTVTTFTAVGTAPSPITIDCSTTAEGDHFHLVTAGVQSVEYCTISRSQAS